VVSLDPPALLISLDYEGRMSTLVPEAGQFTVSILDQRHEFAAERFAGRAPLVDERLSGVAHELAPSGLPVLAGALAWFDCRVKSVHDGGDHLLVMGDIDQVATGADTDAPLLYYEGRYRSLDPS
jgi:3-hydroxy-9,10-secoandrosta-1,3,5(10)-triene-9,17-dione monooxygenase reductase component